MGFAPRVKHRSLKGPIHGGWGVWGVGACPTLCFYTKRILIGFPATDFAVFICFQSLEKASWKRIPPQKHLGDHPIAFKIRQGKARENTLWGAFLLQQDKWIKILLGLFQLSLLGNLSLDPRCFIALDVSCATEPHRFMLPEDLALALELVEEQVCPLKHLTTCWYHHQWAGHSHGVKGSPRF